MDFTELDEATRAMMLLEFLAEQESGVPGPYRPANLTALGLEEFPRVMELAIRSGNEVSLTQDLARPEFWIPEETDYRGVVRKFTPEYRGRRAGQTEFNTWYVRGLSRRLLDEGETGCEIYSTVLVPRVCGECSLHEGQRAELRAIHGGHRARYHFPPADRSALSVPFHPFCHHSIRRAVESG